MPLLLCSPSSLPQLQAAMSTIASVSRKRKRDEEKILLGEPFVIQPHLSSVFDTSLKITPAVLFPRKYIPLNWLTGVPSRLFSAFIPALDSPRNILITKTDGERQLSAVEKVSDGVFTLFKLSPLVKMKDVRRLAQLARKAVPPDLEKVELGKKCLEKDWWADLLIDNFTAGMGEWKGHTTVLSMIYPSKAKQNIKTPATDLRLLSPPAEITMFKEPTATEALEQTKAQYLEALYVAKTSIAYFAKSTLSRARVKFQQEATEDSSSPPSIPQLVEFLQGMIIPLDKMDIKFRKVIMQVATEEAIQDTTIFKAGEEFYVQRWLSMNFKDKVLQNSDPALKRQTEDLKIRETELQIILLLEILALTKDKTLPTEPEEDSKKKKSKKNASRKRKSKGAELPDPSVLLDLLLDRLCIWRSIGSLEPPAERERQKSSHAKEGEEDRLKNFCIEVVMPFYSSRLPDICSMIQKKICGTTALPGSTRKPFIETSKRRKVPSLSRSKIAPVISLSREAVPANLLALPKATAKNVDLGAVAKKTLQKREIQMPSLNAKPVVNVEEELKSAIRALAKPNRIAAGAEIMDAATKRMSGSGSSMRKQKKPVRNPNANSILVHATPSKTNHLRQQAQPVQHMLPQTEDEDEDEDSFLPPPLPPSQRNTQSASSAAAVFDSPIDSSYKSATIRRPSYLNHSSLAAKHVDMVPESSPGLVLSTPLKGLSTVGRKTGLILGSALIGRYADDDTVPESSPIKAKRFSGSALSRSRSCLFPNMGSELSSVQMQKPLVLGTPQKRKRAAMPFHDEDGDEDTEVDGDGLTSSVFPSSVIQTPVRTRPMQLTRAKTLGAMSTSTGNPSARLDFSAVRIAANSPMKGSWGDGSGGGGSCLEQSEGSRKSLRLDIDGEEEARESANKAVEKEKETEVETELDIYQSLGWDDF
ncbi:DNA replication regulator SLD3-domain-containing protein [Tirmania nivea]|nr:DNA replication regulator SLD3-domain-containing protein [Tirmania nivea]